MAALPPQDPTCWYDANFDEELVEVRRQAEHTCWLINQLDPQDAEKHQQLLGELLGLWESGWRCWHRSWSITAPTFLWATAAL